MIDIKLHIDKAAALLKLSRGLKNSPTTWHTQISYDGNDLWMHIEGNPTCVDVKFPKESYESTTLKKGDSIRLNTGAFFSSVAAFKAMGSVHLKRGKNTLLLKNGNREIKLTTSPTVAYGSPTSYKVGGTDISSLEVLLRGSEAVASTTGISVLQQSNLLTVDSGKRHIICLTDVSSFGIAKTIKGKTSQDIDTTFGIPTDEMGVALSLLNRWTGDVDTPVDINFLMPNDKADTPSSISWTASNGDSEIIVSQRLLDESVYKPLLRVLSRVTKFAPAHTLTLNTGALKDCMKAALAGDPDQGGCVTSLSNKGSDDVLDINTVGEVFTDTMPVAADCTFELNLKNVHLLKILNRASDAGMPHVEVGLEAATPAIAIDVGVDTFMMVCLKNENAGIRYEVEELEDDTSEDDDPVVDGEHTGEEGGTVQESSGSVEGAAAGEAAATAG